VDETRIQAQLQHPGVAQIIDCATDEDDCPYAVVEFVEGRHLGEIVARSNQLGIPVDWADAAAIGICFADALAHIHERKDHAGRPLEIAHRDLSPQNIMVGYSGDVKLIDFGTARGENRRCRTVSGIVYAKPGYVAPEVANQIPGGAPADIYAMGVMIWEMVSGRRFLQGDAVEHQAQVAHGNRPLPRLASEVGCPVRLDEVLAKMTAYRVEDRYPTAKRAVAELVELLKAAPSLADGDRSVRGRIAHMMSRFYPAEPARSRADFARRVTHARGVKARLGSTWDPRTIARPTSLRSAEFRRAT
jgi:eukaryotic-like serine/threonine-protein kinase